MDKTEFDKLTDTGKHRAFTAAEQRAEKLQELLNFARLAIRSANGNLIALDEKIANVFKEVVSKS